MPTYHSEVRSPDADASRGKRRPAGQLDGPCQSSKAIGELLPVHAGEIWADQDWQMDVTDERGLILYSVVVSSLMSTAAAGAGDFARRPLASPAGR